jgi:hypothetical protein
VITYGSYTSGYITEPTVGTAQVEIGITVDGHTVPVGLTPGEAHELGRKLLTAALRAGHRPQ